jgi:hypothetical protein
MVPGVEPNAVPTARSKTRCPVNGTTGRRQTDGYSYLEVEESSMNPARVDFAVDLAYGVLIFVAIGLILAVGTNVGVAFGLGALVAYVVHIGWKMSRFDPDWMTREVTEQVTEEVEETVGDTVSEEIDDVAHQVEETVGEEMTAEIEETVSQQIEETVGDEVDEMVEKLDEIEERTAEE